MDVNQITAESMTTCLVDADGRHIRINVRSDTGTPASLVLPVQCVTQMLMALPRLIQVALQRLHSDNTLRLVHPLSAYTIERGQCDRHGEQQYILTLETEGGFAVSFTVPLEELSALAASVEADVVPDAALNPWVARHLS